MTDLLRQALVAREVDEVLGLVDRIAASPGPFGASSDPLPVESVGRPTRPELVDPRKAPRRSPHTEAGRVAQLHALAHIEWNAVKLALDASHRFGGLPPDYHADWIGVAVDEAHHFRLLRARLRDAGVDYGDLPAHGQLWASAVRTAHDPMVRMALVPRVLEARGLDVTPQVLERFRVAGDGRSAAVLRVILRDEIRHVAVGDRWFRHLCTERGIEAEPTFRALLADHGVRVVRPFNEPARLEAGFTAEELAAF